MHASLDQMGFSSGRMLSAGRETHETINATTSISNASNACVLDAESRGQRGIMDMTIINCDFESWPRSGSLVGTIADKAASLLYFKRNTDVAKLKDGDRRALRVP